ncbi:MAG: MBL fold metallo-hydrolase [Clostridia bacterium]|nr:MBL fold metallo-hydrolase [Clostridia bacterium]
MQIDYLGHSGFLVETETALLLFDYYRGALSFLEKKPKEKPLFVFVSHAHADHFNPFIFKIGGRNVTYLLSFDLKGSPKVKRTATSGTSTRTAPMWSRGSARSRRFFPPTKVSLSL